MKPEYYFKQHNAKVKDQGAQTPNWVDFVIAGGTNHPRYVVSQMMPRKLCWYVVRYQIKKMSPYEKNIQWQIGISTATSHWGIFFFCFVDSLYHYVTEYYQHKEHNCVWNQYTNVLRHHVPSNQIFLHDKLMSDEEYENLPQPF